MFNRVKFVFLIAISSVVCVQFLPSCKSDKGKNIPDVSQIDAQVELIQFDVELFDLDSTASNEVLLNLRKKHPAMWDLYFQHIIPIAKTVNTEEELLDLVRDELSNERMRWIHDTTYTIYRNIAPITDEFRQAFQFYKYYFPGQEPPRLYTINSEFGYFPFIFEDDDGSNALGISLEMFLGEDFPYQTYLGNATAFSSYLTRSYNQEHIVKRSLDVLVDDHATGPTGERLIDLMIHNGKKLYVVSELIPFAHDSIIMSYSLKDLEWCQNNERNLWAHFLHEDLLYNQERMKINKLITPSPNAPGLPQDAPGDNASWVGWQIVKNFMARHPDMTLQELLDITDAQEILDKSKYKPRF